jgi:uncharacterized phage protein (TIGR01671 family)
MSREIKFRLHCKGTGKILAYEKFNTTLNWGYYWYDATLPEDDQICQTSNYFRHEHPIGQVVRVEFTGLLDANGVEIYEGDIVKMWYAPRATCNGFIELSGGCFVFNTKQATPNVSSLFACFNESGNTLTVIGNIYQNPELLK